MTEYRKDFLTCLIAISQMWKVQDLQTLYYCCYSLDSFGGWTQVPIIKQQPKSLSFPDFKTSMYFPTFDMSMIGHMKGQECNDCLVTSSHLSNSNYNFQKFHSKVWYWSPDLPKLWIDSSWEFHSSLRKSRNKLGKQEIFVGSKSWLHICI